MPALNVGSLPNSVRSYRPFIVATLAFLFIMQLGTAALLLPEALKGRPDFRAFYTAGYMVRSGYAHELYDYNLSGQLQNKLVSRMDHALPFYHLAYEALLFVPFSWMSYRQAYISFFFVNVSLLCFSCWITRPYLRRLAEAWKWLPIALFFCFFPVTSALIQGQDSIALLALATGAFISLQKRQDFRAGLLTGLALFKFQFALPMLVLFVAWGWRRAVAGFLLATAVVVSISLYLIGLSSAAIYPRYLISLSVAMKTQVEHQRYGIYPANMPNLRGLFDSLAGHHLPHSAVQVTTILCSILLIYLIARGRPSFSLAVVTALLVSYHGNIHDATLLLIPIGVLGAACFGEQGPRSWWTMGMICLVFLMPTVLWLETLGSFWLMAVPLLALIALAARQADAIKPYGAAR